MKAEVDRTISRVVRFADGARSAYERIFFSCNRKCIASRCARAPHLRVGFHRSVRPQRLRTYITVAREIRYEASGGGTTSAFISGFPRVRVRNFRFLKNWQLRQRWHGRGCSVQVVADGSGIERDRVCLRMCVRDAMNRKRCVVRIFIAARMTFMFQSTLFMDIQRGTWLPWRHDTWLQWRHDTWLSWRHRMTLFQLFPFSLHAGSC